MAVALACLRDRLEGGAAGGLAVAQRDRPARRQPGDGALFVMRTLSSNQPVVKLRTLGDRDFALGCSAELHPRRRALRRGLSDAGVPRLVRNHNALEIGEVMMVTGAAQLAMAPVAVLLERRVSARLLTVIGFGLFAVGLAASAFQTRATDFEEMFAPQVIRGVAIMLCLLPPIRLALGHLPPQTVPDASGLFNLMRNLGGAIGLALIDTVIYGRAPVIGERLGQALARGDVETAKLVGLPLDKFLAHTPGAPLEPAALAYVRAAVQRQATVEAVNEAWAMVAALTLAGALAAYVVKPRVAEEMSTQRKSAK